MDKAVIVTGSSGFLGKTLVESAARMGYAVVCHTHRHASETQAFAEGLQKKYGVPLWTLAADLERNGEADRLFAESVRVTEENGFILTVITNNACPYPVDTLATAHRDTLTGLVAVQISAVLELTRALVKYASEKQITNASVVNIGDARVGLRDPRHATYLLVKGMLRDLTVQMARDFAPTVRVNAVAPGLLSRDSLDLHTAMWTLLGHVVSPEEVADAVFYLAEARFVTGVWLPVDSGRSIKS